MEQKFDIKLATYLANVNYAIFLESFNHLFKKYKTEYKGNYYSKLSSTEMLSAMPYFTKDELINIIKYLYSNEYLLVLSIYDNEYKLFATTHKLDELIKSLHKNKKSKEIVDEESILLSYGFDNEELIYVKEWLDFRSKTYNLKKTSQAIKVQCNHLKKIKEHKLVDGGTLDLIKVIKWVMTETTWENIHLDYVINELRRKEKIHG